ncbi:uncharacterized protein JN550_010349 [Neoarthrinium moseri]|uniref:uncharacterized protein n=1 Tax=Neoarthrinium moseri TaxID=1658444 RepID=UPI001FDC490C|nr:uncharacterized protein JN550_010349 [Neoarthrinium moseri]KAI1862193.1 hypothetical protein JN550_010349 [Neoarthrinium moseri]
MVMSTAPRASTSSSFQAFAVGLLGMARGRKGASGETNSLSTRDATVSVDTRSTTRVLLEWSALSSWRQQGSEHLQSGYRPDPETLVACLASWTYVHNETGALIFASLPHTVFNTDAMSRYEAADKIDLFVCSIYFFGVGTCFVLSTTFHTFMHHSKTTYDFGIKLDYAGILLLIYTSTFPLILYTFPCRMYLQALYIAVITSLAGGCMLATFHPSIGGPHLGHVRAFLFGSVGLASFLIPILHGILAAGLEEQSARVGLCWIWLTVLCNGLGVVAYAFKFPETWYPRRFDIVGASHQIMHTMVVFAALAYTKAVLVAFDYRHSHHPIC